MLAHPPAPPVPPQSAADLAVGPDFQALRWFLMPDEAATELAAELATSALARAVDQPASRPGSGA